MSAQLSAEQKALETRRNRLQAIRKILNVEIEDKKLESSSLKKRIVSLQTEIDNLRRKLPSKIMVSEHAMLRYLDRIRGVDLQEVQDEILTQESIDIINQLGNCSINTPAGFKIVVKNNTVVSVSQKEKEE